jgi:hypothetical protein
MIRVVHPGSRIPDPDADFYPSRIPDPGVKKAPDPGSATLLPSKEDRLHTWRVLYEIVGVVKRVGLLLLQKITCLVVINQLKQCCECESGFVYFGPPGSGSRSFFYQAKKSKKNLDIYYCFEKNIIFVVILKASDEKSRIRIRNLLLGIRGSGSVIKCHGSTTLINT